MVLGGTMLVMVAACSHRPLGPWSTADAAAHDQRVAAERLAALPGGGLLVCELGVFRVLWCDDFTASARFWGTRRREKTA